MRAEKLFSTQARAIRPPWSPTNSLVSVRGRFEAIVSRGAQGGSQEDGLGWPDNPRCPVRHLQAYIATAGAPQDDEDSLVLGPPAKGGIPECTQREEPVSPLLLE